MPEFVSVMGNWVPKEEIEAQTVVEAKVEEVKVEEVKAEEVKIEEVKIEEAKVEVAPDLSDVEATPEVKAEQEVIN